MLAAALPRSAPRGAFRTACHLPAASAAFARQSTLSPPPVRGNSIAAASLRLTPNARFVGSEPRTSTAGLPVVTTFARQRHRPQRSGSTLYAPCRYLCAHDPTDGGATGASPVNAAAVGSTSWEASGLPGMDELPDSLSPEEVRSIEEAIGEFAEERGQAMSAVEEALATVGDILPATAAADTGYDADSPAFVAAKHLPKSVVKANDICAVRAYGCKVWDKDENEYLDFTSGIGAVSTGHCHPRVVASVLSQSATLVHAQQNIFATHPAQVDVIRELLATFPEGSDLSQGKMFFASSGSEAVDNVIKIVRASSKRSNIVSFDGAFHGRTIGAMSITSSQTYYRKNFQPLMPGAFTAQYPRCLTCGIRKAMGANAHSWYNLESGSNRRCCNSWLTSLEELFTSQTAPEETAAIIVEPIQGEGGVSTPPPLFFQQLRSICDKYGILLVYDEVQSGAGRTGRWWAHEHWVLDEDDPVSGAKAGYKALEPDILIFAKGVASGFPFAGVITRASVLEAVHLGGLGGTYGGNAVASAAATATLQVIRSERLVENAALRGVQLSQGLRSIANRFPEIMDIRGRGLMVGVQLTGPSVQQGDAKKVVKECANRGLLLLTAGSKETLRFLPPLVVSEDEIAQGLKIVEAALAAVFR